MLNSIEIVDFSPEWDYTQGGVKILVCIKPHQIVESILSAGFESKFQLSFGQASAQNVTFI
jgi:hypothetical protein